MIVHNAVYVSKPTLVYKDTEVEYVTSFKCLEVEIGTKLGMGKNIESRLQKVKSSYCALKQLCRRIPANYFVPSSLPHFSWLFSPVFIIPRNSANALNMSL